MDNIILVAGATGDLGGRVCENLLGRGVAVRAIVRSKSNQKRVFELRELGVQIVATEYDDEYGLTLACQGVSCIVSTLAGLGDVIVKAQSLLLKSAIQAGVPKFIPSDFSTDFDQLKVGDNRNFDLRKEFQTIINASNIQATSIFNGAFAHILAYNTPLLDIKNSSISYYAGKANWNIDFTTIADTAAFTARVALDNDTPRSLYISSFKISPLALSQLANEVFDRQFEWRNAGTLEDFAAYTIHTRAENPKGELELYSQWQQMQYMYSMFAAQNQRIDNDRYDGLTWQTAKETLLAIKS
ncbi:NmrA family NAD(P)-binding protein [Sphingobacterium paludis]|uniref:Uncharacterized protein YbjT (DUF2867 family) n=1 Tax=Sphingobacterium paludis TaxID=1476465 RepID=A0A4R7CSB5_9SPHI|nr:NmrA family NAD(P)-binding protein [Sphingobacterium paludis]TDS05963.1 uncharacterized protein YbjT (DUF2867 family) [Sphingobacterium paludis]